MKLFDNGACHHTMLNKLKNILRNESRCSGINCPNQLDHLFDIYVSGFAELKGRTQTVPDELREDWLATLDIYKQKIKVVQN